MKLNRKLKFLAIPLTLFCLVLTASVFENRVSANTYYFELYGGSPLQQNWTDINQITTDDNWNSVISFQGFRGDGLTASTGTDPQTITADGQSTTPLDVNANQTNPNTFNTGGLTEFEITDPTIALKGSDTADAPHLMVYLDTSPCPASKSISLRYNVRDIDGSANDAIQQLSLQYRIGTTGAFINVPAGFVADATEPNAATKVTPRFINMPQSIVNQPQVEIRFITANAAGTDEWIGIDDIEIGCFFPTEATISAGGRVLNADGQSVYRANVSIVNTFSQSRQVTTTNPFGYFTFDGLESGGLFTINIGHKTYTFTTSKQTFQLFDDKKDFIFYADRPSYLIKRNNKGFSK